jgi:formylglycine-generating enzyme required for sulfatase activity
VRIVFVLLVCLLLPSPALAEKRVALVIGNSAYQYTPKLANPKNDAADMAAVLKTLGFQVLDGFDLDKAAFERKVRDFASALKGADAGVFFYAGHGLQVLGQNYLVPIDAKAEEAAGLDLEMVRVDVVHRIMERQASTNILFLDACRDNPLARNLARTMGARSAEVSRGLAAVESGFGTLISFSTQPGAVALDGTGRNSPFSGSLVKHVSSSDDDVGAVLISVRNDVMKETQRQQVPWEHSALTGRFYFNPSAQTPTKTPAQPQSSEAERAWDRTKDTTSIPALEAFIRRFGDTYYGDLAKVRLAELKETEAAARKKAEEDARAEGERQRLALLKAEDERKRAEAMRPGTEFRDCTDGCPTMVVVPAGSFTMGRNGGYRWEQPPHRVKIARPFAVGKFEATFAEWEACVAGGGCTGNRSPSDQGWGRGRRPVISVSWDDAKEYVAWLSHKTGKGYRLLSDAEWEYAARAGTTTRYAFGDTISESQASNGSQTVEVGSFPANKFGLHDMHGNVWEWVEDNWHDSHQGAPNDGSVWPGGDVSLRAVRGGSWTNPIERLGSSSRIDERPDKRSNVIGFRVARTL